MALVVIPYTFSPNTLAQSAQVNANFTALANFINNGSGTFATPGYVILPGGLIIQWGSATVAGDGSAALPVSFPLTFPTNVFAVLPGTAQYNSGDGAQLCNGTEDTSARSTTGATFRAIGGSATPVTFNWIAIGN